MTTRLRRIQAVVVLACCLFGAIAGGDVVDWKGITWTISSGSSSNVTVNPDDTVTLTGDATTTDVFLYAQNLPGLAGEREAWLRFSYWDSGNQSHRIDMYAEEGGSAPRLGTGSLWSATKVAVTRYTDPVNGTQEQYAIFSSYAGDDADGNPTYIPDRANIYHTVLAEKLLDGTIEFTFDSDSTVSTTHIKDNVGGDWAFNYITLRVRGLGDGESVTMTDFQYGAVPEPSTLGLVGLLVMAVVRRFCRRGRAGAGKA